VTYSFSLTINKVLYSKENISLINIDDLKRLFYAIKDENNIEINLNF